MQVLRFGYCIPFRSVPLLSHVPLPLPNYSPSSIRGIASAAAVVNLQEKGAVELAPSSPGYCSRPFVTPKVTGRWHPVIDLSRLNRAADVSHFHMETSQSVLQSLCLGDWMVSLDLQDAYLQVPVHPSFCRYLRFCLGDSVLQFRSFCFVLSTALHTFICVMALVSSVMHRYGFRIVRYLDDWLVLGSSFQEIVRARDFLLWFCQELAGDLHQHREELLDPVSVHRLGMRLQPCPLRVFPTPKCVLKLSSLVHDFVSCHQHPLALWRQLLGVLSSMSSVVTGSHLCMRLLQLRLNGSM